jgi:hypothetical protein
MFLYEGVVLLRHSLVLLGRSGDWNFSIAVREQRIDGLVHELAPRVRRLNPNWSDDEIIEMAESMAELRGRVSRSLSEPP